MFAQKDWKYWITHPDKDFVSNKQDKEADDQIIFNNGKNRPVVILFGWAGCQDKHLLHYSKIYEDQGLITITYSCAFKNLFFENNNMLRIGKEMVEPLKMGII
ncbi:hypothetical protein HHI36_021392 [Cryptolaemus montrouzieri]|uniref:Uncharacterized protein n=1 Tax=Cryptolaemus montrouzieri TaxID=559131 RepID=A0ABD2MXG7_9CUCU